MPLPSTKTSWKQWIIVLFVFAPVLFINVSSSHDWGDDFAQYILQAKCIVEGNPQTTYAIVDKEYYPVLGPPTRPVGLPLLLAPFYYFFGNNMFVFSCLMSACYYVMALLVFRFLRQIISFLPSLLWACTMIYNPQFLQLKLAILSDFPFIILLFLFFDVVKRSLSTKQVILLSILTGLMISFRLIAVLIIPVYFLFWFTNKSNRRNITNFIRQPLLFSILSIVIFLTLNFIFLRNTIESWNSYSFISALIDHTRLLDTIHYYTFVYTLIYEQEIWGFANLLLKSFMVVIACIGFIISLRRKINAEDWFFLIYLGTMFMYPSNSAAIRFLMPVFPMLLLYQIEGLKSIQLPSYKLNSFKIYIIPIILLLTYKINLQNIFQKQGQIQEGPYKPTVVSAFEFIKTTLPKEKMYAFTKHHAFMLYADRRCVPARDNLSLLQLKKMLSKYQVKYLLYVEKVSGENILQLVQAESFHYKLIWQNKKCKIFELL